MEVLVVKIVVDKDLYFIRESKINLCELVEINGEWIIMVGLIEEFSYF